MKDFSKKNKPADIEFTIDGDTFYAWPIQPAENQLRLATMGSTLSETPDFRAIIDKVKETLQILLKPESYSLLEQRITDVENPIDLDQLNDIAIWLGNQVSDNSKDGEELVEVPLPGEGESSNGVAAVTEDEIHAIDVTT